MQSGIIAGTARTYTTTSSYDPTTGRLTGSHDDLTGGATASYSLDGALLRQTWTDAAAGPLSETALTDTAGTPVERKGTQGARLPAR